MPAEHVTELVMAIPLSRRLDFSEIPVIDVGPLVADRVAAATVDALGRACRDVGFLYVSNHGVPASLVADLAREAAAFFRLPLGQRQAIALNQRMRGYIPLKYRSYEGEARAGTSHQEAFWVGPERAENPENFLDGSNQWPVAQPALKDVMMRYFAAVEGLSLALMRGFSLALGLDAQFFGRLFERPNSRLKLNHYPPQDQPDNVNDIGVVPHADSGGFTILWQDDIGGLEVQSKSGEWVGAPPIPDTFVVNLGNLMQIWTDGQFSSTPHRVINRGGRDRYSIPLFVNPNHMAPVAPLVGLREAVANPVRYRDYQKAEWRRIFPIANIPA
jgi:isopenicillin N synthase-like dioxygenase